ncbi:MAG: polysaccharide biosynthesis protein, partial [Deltaproteobacteria bacterium]|nr:polysaccharide biosynthesis protein [Deltaproteobacteria bacterium]
MDIREKSERCGRPAKLWHRVRDILFQRTDRKRIVWFLFWDVIIILSSLYFAFLLRFDGKIPSSYLEQFRIYAIFFLAVKLPIFYYFRLYHMSWRYVGFYELISVAKATTLSAILLGAIAFLKPNFLFHVFPRSILIIDFLLTLSMVGGHRVMKRSYIQVFKCGKNSKPQKRILIVGAGDAGERIVREMKKSPISEYLPVGFVDDDEGKQNVLINGVKVFWKRESIPKLVKKLQAEEVLIAIPSAPAEVIRDMVALARESGVESIKILPGLQSLLSGDATLADIREVQLEDLLGRAPVTIDTASIEDYLSGKRVLITGAAGSIGSELVRQVARFQPAEIVLFEIDETELFYLVQQIEKDFKNIHPIVGDVRDASKVERVFSDFSPQVVFHAAAYKHVPMMESHPDEAVKVNVIGTKIVAEIAMKQGVEKFVFISTDKAVNPTSVMGATKRVAEY